METANETPARKSEGKQKAFDLPDILHSMRSLATSIPAAADHSKFLIRPLSGLLESDAYSKLPHPRHLIIFDPHPAGLRT